MEQRYIPDSLTLIMITSNIKDAFDPMMEEASDMEDEITCSRKSQTD